MLEHERSLVKEANLVLAFFEEHGRFPESTDAEAMGKLKLSKNNNRWLGKFKAAKERRFHSPLAIDNQISAIETAIAEILQLVELPITSISSVSDNLVGDLATHWDTLLSEICADPNKQSLFEKRVMKILKKLGAEKLSNDALVCCNGSVQQRATASDVNYKTIDGRATMNDGTTCWIQHKHLNGRGGNQDSEKVEVRNSILAAIEVIENTDDSFFYVFDGDNFDEALEEFRVLAKGWQSRIFFHYDTTKVELRRVFQEILGG